MELWRGATCVNGSVRLQSLPWGILGGDCLQREANLSQARFSSRLFCASSPHLGYVLDWEAELCLWEHSWLSYKLLLLMAMSPGPVCASICTPAPCPLLGAWHSTRNCPRGSCRFGARFSLVHTVFLPLLLATSAWKSVPISLGVPVSIRLWPLVGSHGHLCSSVSSLAVLSRS